jgi:hypothetical protein
MTNADGAGAELPNAVDAFVPPPPGAPVPVDSIEAVFAVPDVGWMDTTLQAGDQIFEFSLSDYDGDPIPGLIDSLEQLVDGEFPHLIIDLEYWVCAFRTYPADDDVRLVIADEVLEPEIFMDIRIDRTALVAGVYNPLVAHWESDAFARAWFHWNFTTPDLADLDHDNPPERMTPDPIRSAKIDAALKACGEQR